ncbi:hypothetical protein [Adhaeribacter rhizoryzae]|uniref:Uncharacterized protein n=1 Tax=Adhaeribacter rhizoryzae TaxID=2607907 RepID=A0A5M6D902_9BACT|nr:hypothetical protein [Adhaeribacter rhizoryzae]KAA5541675.1 hypothetical protein F0145_20095 [Adhaeribacter rhizoryzae]
MEKLIFIHSALILILLVAVLGLLLWEEINEANQVMDSKTTPLLSCVSLIAGLILHLNWIILPWAREQKGDLVAVANFGVLVITFSLLIWYWYKSFIDWKAKHSR